MASCRADPTVFAARAIRRALYLPLLLTALVAAAVLWQVLRLRSCMVEVDRTTRAMSSEVQAFRLLIDGESGLRGYLLTHDRAFLDRATRARADLPAAIAALESQRDYPDARAAASELRDGAARWHEYERRVLAMKDPGEAAGHSLEGKGLMDEMRAKVEARIGALQDERNVRESRARESTETTLAGLAMLAVVLAGVTTIYVRRDLVAVARAYTEALDEAARARDDAEESSRIKDEFLGTISHELRTPLNAILGWSALLARRPDDPGTRQRALETIDRNARTQARLIEDMLDVSRVVSGQLNLRVESFDLGRAIGTATESLSPAARAKRVRLDVDIDPEGRWMRGDVRRVQQVVWNLVGNAVKFTPAGGRVRVTTRRVDGDVEIRVADSGPGIARDLLPHVFERFRQGDSSPTRRHGGLGLGLAIVRHLVELHGGGVHVESPGAEGGATFVVVLPRPPLPAEPPRDAVTPIGLQPVTR